MDSFYIDYSRLPFVEYEHGLLILIGVIIGIPLIVALVATLVQISKMKTARSEDYASNYIKQGSFNLTASHDIFLYTRTTRVAKPKQNNRHGGRN